MKRNPSPCPMDQLLRLLSGPWTTHILWALQQTDGLVRFGVLKREIEGISARLLAQRLRLLVEAGLVARQYRPTIPPEVSYGLTDKGRALGEALSILDHLAQHWSHNNPPDALSEHARLRAEPDRIKA
ncbi:MAG: winged helix-turn-helix transcriptional regulator [Acidiferrobacteraceae bacterium]